MRLFSGAERVHQMKTFDIDYTVVCDSSRLAELSKVAIYNKALQLFSDLDAVNQRNALEERYLGAFPPNKL